MDTKRGPKRAREDDGYGGTAHSSTPVDEATAAAAAPSIPTAHPSMTTTSRTKLPRIDNYSSGTSIQDEYSSVVKNKLQSYTRTGQACDRCKVRKIRCDALPEGCSHCLSQNLECYVTDRISGRTERRGYLQDLEREKTAMAQHIEQLQTLLAEKGGVEVLPWRWSPYTPVCPPGVVLDSNGNEVNSSSDDKEALSESGSSPQRQWSRTGSVWWRPATGSAGNPESSMTTTGVIGGHASETATTASLSIPNTPTYRYDTPSNTSALQSWPTDSYLGVYADCAPLSSVNGTQVSILGTLLDIDAAGPGVEPAPSAVYREPTGLYNRSLGSFLRSAMNINPSLDNSVELPSRSDAIEYSQWYFLMVHPFAPILHKSTYMALLMRIYDDPKFQPTTSELVIVHMVFAAIYFQFGVRNRETLARQIHLHELSNKHYHWALSKYYYMASDYSVTAVQALVLITLYTRAFPKPSCGSTIAMYAITKAIDLGLHRSTGIPVARTTLANELRKRAWWGALMLAATLNGRLGRPMPIRVEDFDTELPVAIDDEYLTEEGITDLSMIGKAPFLVGLHAMRFTPLYMDMFSHLYGVRRDPHRYASLVRDLEAQYHAIQATMPSEIHIDTCKPALTVQALYAQAVSLEFLLCLRHPSACMTADPHVFAENTRLCAETARTLLGHVQKLLVLKSLDTTWYQMSVYCAALFSMLAAAWERRFMATAAEIEQLQDDTSIWLSIIAEMGLLAGASDDGQPFNSKLTQICARTIFGILRDMPAPARRAVMDYNVRAIQERQASGQVGPTQGALSAANGAEHGTASTVDKRTNRATRLANSNIDCVALHLETQARLKLEGRGQLSPAPHQQQQRQQQQPPQLLVQAQQALQPAAHYDSVLPMPSATSHSSYTLTAPYSPPQQQQQRQPHHPQPLMSFTPGALGAPANPWANWTASIADSQSHDAFASADALMDLEMLHLRLAPSGVLGGVQPEHNHHSEDVASATNMGVVLPVTSLQAPMNGQHHQQQHINHHHLQQQHHNVVTAGQVHTTDVEAHAHSAQWPLLIFQ
ncbi:hypothetical protein SEPCBS57363_002200 [Sporothrix epigloea]|uniref:Zn(2)-C6 fungal-type domain-containing protein n=1 Tax=Sporothrix epigloea TaxID=1892477 RepID=A0ABP0DIJ1_9PEZI